MILATDEGHYEQCEQTDRNAAKMLEVTVRVVWMLANISRITASREDGEYRIPQPLPWHDAERVRLTIVHKRARRLASEQISKSLEYQELMAHQAREYLAAVCECSPRHSSLCTHGPGSHGRSLLPAIHQALCQ